MLARRPQMINELTLASQWILDETGPKKGTEKARGAGIFYNWPNAVDTKSVHRTRGVRTTTWTEVEPLAPYSRGIYSRVTTKLIGYIFFICVAPSPRNTGHFYGVAKPNAIQLYGSAKWQGSGACIGLPEGVAQRENVL